MAVQLVLTVCSTFPFPVPALVSHPGRPLAIAAILAAKLSFSAASTKKARLICCSKKNGAAWTGASE